MASLKHDGGITLTYDRNTDRHPHMHTANACFLEIPYSVKQLPPYARPFELMAARDHATMTEGFSLRPHTDEITFPVPDIQNEMS